MPKRGHRLTIKLTEWRYRLLQRSTRGIGSADAEMQRLVDQMLDAMEPATPEENLEFLLTPGASERDRKFEKAVLDEISNGWDKSVDEVTQEMKVRGFHAGSGWSDERMWNRIARILMMMGYRKYRATADQYGSRLWRYKRHKGVIGVAEHQQQKEAIADIRRVDDEAVRKAAEDRKQAARDAGYANG